MLFLKLQNFVLMRKERNSKISIWEGTTTNYTIINMFFQLRYIKEINISMDFIKFLDRSLLKSIVLWDSALVCYRNYHFFSHHDEIILFIQYLALWQEFLMYTLPKSKKEDTTFTFDGLPCAIFAYSSVVIVFHVHFINSSHTTSYNAFYECRGGISNDVRFNWRPWWPPGAS